MSKPPKRPRDMMQLAKFIGEASTDEHKGDPDPEPQPEPVAAKRGRARAEKLTPETRKSIAQKAARKRWKKAD
jgi:hypothetical protein